MEPCSLRPKVKICLISKLTKRVQKGKSRRNNRRSKYIIPRENQRERGACVWTEMNVFTKNMINDRAKAPEVLRPVYISSILIIIPKNKKTLKSREK